ncbi:sulfotransferase domain-containing protein [Pseudooceanicola onchidii]|uniref:sulfotransferase domain-containing protein n=1 Tax=Pseudooceanicola onchidii TaxID=2562279 RepID=UPI00145BFCF7|nr:sulfotransferase domain-containing protein [Pseudooceanicola onchidii]
MTNRKIYLGTLTDSTRWDAVAIRPDDVIVVSPPKSGTTWMQTIVALLLSGDPQVVPEFSIQMPWVDIKLRDLAEVSDRLTGMTHRRSMKSHTPMDGLPLDDQATYICVFRHPLDAHFSMRNHVRNIPVPWFDDWYPEVDVDGTTFARFLAGSADGADCDAMPLAHIIQHYKAARALADRPNVWLVHYADLIRDLALAFDRISEVLQVTHPAPVMAQLVAAARFDNMRQNAERFAPSGGKGFFKSDEGFFNSGRSGQWQGRLTEAEMDAYDAIMDASLSSCERDWLEYGSPDT